MKVEKIKALFHDLDFLKEYRDWLEHPVTRQVFEAAEEMARPSPLTNPTPETSLYQYGALVGFNRMLAFVRGADEVLSAAETSEIEASYGETRLFNKMFPHIAASKARAQRAKAPAA